MKLLEWVTEKKGTRQRSQLRNKSYLRIGLRRQRHRHAPEGCLVVAPSPQVAPLRQWLRHAQRSPPRQRHRHARRQVSRQWPRHARDSARPRSMLGVRPQRGHTGPLDRWVPHPHRGLHVPHSRGAGGHATGPVRLRHSSCCRTPLHMGGDMLLHPLFHSTFRETIHKRC